MTWLIRYFYWTHNVPTPAQVEWRLWMRVVFGDTRHVWDAYYPDETWRSWVLWEGPMLVLMFVSVPFLVLLVLLMGMLLWIVEQIR